MTPRSATTELPDSTEHHVVAVYRTFRAKLFCYLESSIAHFLIFTRFCPPSGLVRPIDYLSNNTLTRYVR